MSIFTRIGAFFVSLVICFGGIFNIFKPAIPEAKSADELSQLSGLFDKKELADEIYVISTSHIRSEEDNTVRCLQGLVNRDKVQIFISNCWMAEQFLTQLEEQGKTILRTDENGRQWTTERLIEKFKSSITDSGYVLYRDTEFAEGLNTACNLATLYGWLPVPVEIKELAENCGLTLKKDISNDEYSYDYLKNFFNEHKGEFSDKGIIHIKLAAHGLRDFAIQQKMYICYTESNKEGEKFLKTVLNSTAEHGIVMGWCESEKRFVEFISKLGFAICPSDHSYNLSVLSNMESDFTLPERSEKIIPEPDKHYISLIFTDGDNVQWMTNGVPEFYRHLALNADYHMTWGFPIICSQLCPAMNREFYTSADENIDIITGPSGIGYALPSAFEEKSMDFYTTQTAAAMLKSGMRVVTILDDEPLAIKTAAFARKLGYYSRFDNIDGGIIFLDPRMYGAGEGRVWFSDDKPFLTVRKTLWSPENYDGITDEWMCENAAEINSYVADNDSINGYSAICVHAWSLTPENLQKFVALLDDHIEIVSTEQLIQLVTDNVPHKYAKPQ